jgi:hypothetical protein
MTETRIVGVVLNFKKIINSGIIDFHVNNGTKIAITLDPLPSPP